MSSRILRAGAPLLLACAGWWAWWRAPGSTWTALPLLLAPGWGLLRVVSVLDRRFFLVGGALALTPLVLAAPLLAGLQAPGTVVHAATLALCLAGTLRSLWFLRWSARQPPHPAPMPLYPARTPVCLALLLSALAAALWAAPPERPAPDSGHLVVAAQAQGFLAGGEDPFLAGARLGPAQFAAAAVAGLAAGSGCHPATASALLALASLAAVLLLSAEAIARLRGNRGATRAMLAALLGLNPLAALFLVGALARGSGGAPLTARFDPALDTAITPFLGGGSLPFALAFVALLIAATMSTLRRASWHVPRLATMAAFGLVLARPSAALLLLPGWVLGVGWSHLAGRHHPDNDPHPSNRARRPGEPTLLRAPFFGLVLPVLAAAALAWLWVEPRPRFDADGSTIAWGLLAAVAPGCMLFLPGVRQLHASPGREAFFFVGLLLLAVPLALLLRAPQDTGSEAARCLALVLAVPLANGARQLVERGGRRAQIVLTGLVVFLLPGPVWTLALHAGAARPLATVDGRLLLVEPQAARDAESLLALDAGAPRDVVLVEAGRRPAVTTLLARRPVLAAAAHASDPVSAARRLHAANALPTGADAALLQLRAEPGLARRELRALDTTGPWPGFLPGERPGEQRAPPPDIVLVTVSGLGAEAFTRGALPRLAAALPAPLVLAGAVSRWPEEAPGLAALLAGLSPEEARAEPQPAAGLTLEWQARGYRTVALVPEASPAALARDFQRTLRASAQTADALGERALALLAEADARPLLLWWHVAAGPAAASAELDAQLERLARSLSAADLFVLAAPYGEGAAQLRRASAEDGAHRVALVLSGAGLPPGVERGWFDIARLPQLLLTGTLQTSAWLHLRDAEGAVARLDGNGLVVLPPGAERALPPGGADGTPDPAVERALRTYRARALR